MIEALLSLFCLHFERLFTSFRFNFTRVSGKTLVFTVFFFT